MKMKSFALGCASALACAGCAVIGSNHEVTVSRVDSPSAQREYYRNELISHDGLNLESENFLRGNLLQDELTSNPTKVLGKLDEFHRVSGDLKYLLIAADLCSYLATQTDDGDEAIKCYLSCFYYATTFLRRTRQKGNEGKPLFRADRTVSYDITATQGFQSFNEACSGIFSYLRQRQLLDSTSVTLQDLEGRRFVLREPEFRLSVPREAIADFSLCAAYEVGNLLLINRVPGAGVPLVAFVKEGQWYSSLRTPKGLTIPVSFAIDRVEGDDAEAASGVIPLRLLFIDTYRQEVFNEAVGDDSKINVRMALDFSTPMACFLNSISDRGAISRLLDAQELEENDGLYMLEPYQPGKIPVVFIHGLMSSPETWVQMINSLKNDPTIRARYQFWFFSYSTGAPVILSARKLRTALWAAQKEFCTTPEATENFNRMVLVGHSMGGLLTRLMIQDDPNYLFETLYKMPIEQIKAKLQPDDFAILDSATPRPLPFVRRVIFMAVPHRGAYEAQSFSARLGSYLLQLPKSLLSRESAITRINQTLVPEYSKVKEKMRNRYFTGIDNLDPDNPFVLANGNSPLKAGLPYHCIIANSERDGAPEGDDGTVPYWSSHLDNAESELIVKSNHSVQRRPAAIQEVLRILLLHLKAVK